MKHPALRRGRQHGTYFEANAIGFAPAAINLLSFSRPGEFSSSFSGGTEEEFSGLLFSFSEFPFFKQDAPCCFLLSCKITNDSSSAADDVEAKEVDEGI